MLVRIGRPLFNERGVLVEHLPIARRARVLEGCINQPEPIVRYPRADALSTRLMPPVLDVTFRKLTRCRPQQVRADQPGVELNERQNILQLIAEPPGASGLIERRSRVHSAAERLI